MSTIKIYIWRAEFPQISDAARFKMMADYVFMAFEEAEKLSLVEI